MDIRLLLHIIILVFPYLTFSSPINENTIRKCRVRKFNGDFESGSSSPWAFDGRGVSTLSINNDPSNAHSGSYYACA
jgi:hypothetical protein